MVILSKLENTLFVVERINSVGDDLFLIGLSTEVVGSNLDDSVKFKLIKLIDRINYSIWHKDINATKDLLRQAIDFHKKNNS